MKILGIAGSPRKQQTSYAALKKCFDAIQNADNSVDMQIIELADYSINPCIACGTCRNEITCSQKDDFIKLIPVLIDPEVKGIIISSPVYMGSMTAQCKAFLDRSVMFRRNNYVWRDKLAAVIGVGNSRNGGQELTIKSIQSALLIHDMVIVGDGGDSSHFGGTVWSGTDTDKFGDKTLKNLGERFIRILKKLI